MAEQVLMRPGRSLAETPTYAVATLVTVLVFVCFIVERSIYRFGKVENDCLFLGFSCKED